MKPDLLLMQAILGSTEKYSGRDVRTCIVFTLHQNGKRFSILWHTG